MYVPAHSYHYSLIDTNNVMWNLFKRLHYDAGTLSADIRDFMKLNVRKSLCIPFVNRTCIKRTTASEGLLSVFA